MYTPVIRSEPAGDRSLTWAEFVEAGLLRQYRRDLTLEDVRWAAAYETSRAAPLAA